MSERPGNALMPNLLTPMDLEPNWEWRDKLPAHGHMSVDFERRIDHDRLRRYRLARTQTPATRGNPLKRDERRDQRYGYATDHQGGLCSWSAHAGIFH